MKQKLLLQKLLFLLLMLVSASVLNAQSVVSEGWDESSAKEEWSDKKVKWSIEWVTNYSDGSTQRKKFTMSDTRTMTAPDDQCIGNGLSHKTDDWVEILDPEITFVSQETQSQEKNGATFSWVRESRTITDIVKADDTWMRTEMVKERYQKGLSATFTWNACDPFDCKVSFKGKVFAFGRKQVSVRYEGEAISKEEKGMKYHLSYDIGDYVTKLPAFITYDDYESPFFPPEWGWLYDAKQTVSNNRSSNSYVYIWSLHFANGVVLPVVIPAGDTSANWHFEYAEYCDESSEKSYNSAVYNKSKGAWINAVASDAYISIDEESGASTYIPVDDPSQASVMCWMRDGQLLETKTCFDASNCNWDEGHGTSVHTDRYDLDVTNGRLTATDTYRSVYMGSWKARGAGNEDTGIMGTWLSANPTSSNYGDSYKSTKIRIIYNGGGTISVNGKQVQGSSTQVNIDGSADIVIVPNDGYELESVYREIYLLSDDINVYINDNELLLGRLLSKGSGSVLNNFTFTFKEADPEEQEDLQDGDRFTATNADGVEMTFQVISAADKTCEVARQGKDRNTIVTSPVPESITIPAEANGFKVVSIGYQAFYGAKGIKSVIIPEGVTSINTQAFRECYNLASITFPTSLEECGTDSFEDCAFGATVHISDLESWCNVSLPSWDLYGWHLFLNGEEVNNLVIPDGVTSIGESMQHISPLSNCASLTSVTIPRSVTKMYSPFSGCSNLTSVTTFAEEPVAIYTGFPNATNSMSNSIGNATLYVPKGSKAAYEAADYWKAFKEIVEMGGEESDLKDGDLFTALTPEGVEMTFKVISATGKTCQIGDGENCSFSSSYSGTITIPAMANGYSVITIAPWACGQSNITAAIISQGIQNIEDRAFGFNSNLVSISLPEGLTRIGNNIVWGCSKLSSFHVPSTVQEFETQFGWCDALEQITVAEGNTIYDSRDNCNAVIEKATNTLIAGCKATVIPNTVERLSSTSFGFLPSLTEMIIPEGVKALDNQVFAYTSLSTITIPSTVESIGSSSFEDCNNLVDVRINRMTPFTLRDDVFTDIAYNGTLYVPKGSKAAYEAADSWKNFKEIVEVGDAYAIFNSTTGTLTFKCGEKPSGDNVYDAISYPGWRSQMTKVKKVVFDASFAFARPKSTASWFAFEFGDDSSLFTEVIGLQNLNTSEVTSMRNMFSRCRSLTSLDLSHFDTSNVTDMNSMFFYSGLTSLDVSHFNTCNVTDMYNMFSDCSSLTSLDVSNFDTHNVQNMGGMFSGCKALTHINIDNFDTGNVTSMRQMFGWCESLTSLDLRQFNTSNVTDMYMMFYACSNLTSICVSDKWSTENITEGDSMFGFCNKLVGGKGTKYDYNHSDYTYAHIDGGTDNPGYFSFVGRLGDANGDGYVNMKDVNAVKDYIMKGKTEGLNFFNADANGDKVINAADIVKIVKISILDSAEAGAEDPLPDVVGGGEDNNDF